LELIITSFLHLSLNITGWADLLIDFWAVRGHHLRGKVNHNQDVNQSLKQFPDITQKAAIQLLIAISAATTTA
jgi:hypothetical protein